MTVEECFDALKQIQSTFNKMGIDQYTYFNIMCPGNVGTCKNFDEYIEFAKRVDDTEISNYLLNNYKELNFSWTKERDSSGTVTIEAKAYADIEINGGIEYVEVILMLHE